jgi:GAF domain-containing protein
VNRHAVLTAGVQDITQTLSGEYNLNDVLRIILETMYRAMGFQHVLLLVRDPPRSGHEEAAPASARAWRSSSPAATRWRSRRARMCSTRPSGTPPISWSRTSTLPRSRRTSRTGYRKAFNARGFLLFPINVNGKVVALIYADAMESAKLRFCTGRPGAAQDPAQPGGAGDTS